MFWRHTCLQCRRPDRTALCISCWQQIEPLQGQVCRYCNLPLSGESTACADCKTFPHPLYHRAYTLYQGPVQGLIYQFKYHQRPHLAKAIGIYLGQWLTGSQAEALVPIPLHPSRLKQRGYNQAELLAKGIGQVLKIPVIPALAREKNTQALHHLSWSERSQELASAFVLTAEARQLKQKRILLVDDIVTTGATLQTAYQVLAPHVRQLASISLARTPAP